MCGHFQLLNECPVSSYQLHFFDVLNYRKRNSDFLLKLFYYYNLDFYNFINFKMTIHRNFLI